MSKLVNTYEEFKAHTARVQKKHGITVEAVLVTLGEGLNVPWDFACGRTLEFMIAGRPPEFVLEDPDYGDYPEIKVAYWHDAMDAEATAEFEATTSSDAWKYYSGHGSQELFGVIWYSDGSHSHRGEYDGSEWWEYLPTPEIPAWLRER